MRLGKLVSDDVSGDRISVDYGSNPYNTFSNITVQLRPPAWNVGQTLNSWFAFIGSIAWGVIKIILIVSPFALMLIGLATVVRWVVTRVKSKD